VLTTHPLLTPGSRECKAIPLPPPPPLGFRVCYGAPLPFYPFRWFLLIVRSSKIERIIIIHETSTDACFNNFRCLCAQNTSLKRCLGFQKHSIYSHPFHNALHCFEEDEKSLPLCIVYLRCRDALQDHTQATQTLDWMPNGSSYQISIKQNEHEGHCVAAEIMSLLQTPQRYIWLTN
jgi:hypothetical protein